jgi:MoxR-like ATPase
MTAAAAPLARLLANLQSVMVGQETVLRHAVACLLCRGHLLLEDVPGTGKTLLAKTLSRSLRAQFKRLQFTPDLLPSDVTGSTVFHPASGEFQFRPGPVFTEVLLADEINRATPRTQSSLLECMEERQVTQDGTTYPLPPLFFVLATQNPLELHGTFPLPEAQLDRFFMKLSLGHLPPAAEVTVLQAQALRHPFAELQPVLDVAEVQALQQRVLGVHLEETLLHYIAHLVAATREHREVQLGASLRGTLALRRASQALALLEGHDFVTPTHIKQAAYPVLRHRLLLKPQARLTGVTADKVLDDVLASVEVPIS